MKFLDAGTGTVDTVNNYRDELALLISKLAFQRAPQNCAPVTDITGATPLDLALDGGHQDVCQLLLSSLDQPDPSAISKIKPTQPWPLMQKPHPKQPVLQQLHIQPDTFSAIHQLCYALEHPLSPADTVKHHQPDDDNEDHVDTQS